MTLTSIQEDDIFPEIKKNIKNITQVKIYKKSELEKDKEYIQIVNEKHKNGKVVYESQWILKQDLPKLEQAKREIEKYRYDKLRKKNENRQNDIRRKEKRFNKIYDENYYPKNKRKAAYKYFVLSEKSYEKSINKKNIEYFINEKSTIETKDFIKNIKKDLKEKYSNNKDWLLDNFALKKIAYLSVCNTNVKIKRGIEVLYLQKKEIKKIRNRFKNKPLKDIVEYFYSVRFEENFQKEQGLINKAYEYINQYINYDFSNKSVWESAFKKAIKKYHREEALNVFLFEYFIGLNEKLKMFSNNQREKFKVRRKFRNKINLEYRSNIFLVPVFLDFDRDIKSILVENYQNEEELNKKLHDFNDLLISSKKIKYLKLIDKSIKRSLKNIIKYSERNYEFKRLSNLSEKELEKLFLDDFVKTFANKFNSNTDFLKRDLTLHAFNDIEDGIFEDLKGIVKSYLIQDIIKIDYKESFPLARSHKRNIKFFMGETNSGKTYNAFNELVKAKSGVYLSPLRLLALEGQEEIEKRGKLCSMETGEEVDIKEGATFKSCTIEMLDIQNFVESIVIDEIQMIKDPNRGWAWVQALIGSPAKNIILAGSKEVLNIIKAIVDYTGDNLEVVEYKRKSPLIVEDNTVKVENLNSGTALIAFSRRKVLEYREKLKDRKVSVIYGNLGPEVRKEEARKFREGETDILIATDAIAMGLNLPIEKIVFSTHQKTIRGERVEISKQLVKQIAGRAGRYGIKNKGFVSALNNATLKYVKKNVEEQMENYNDRVPIMPNVDYLEKIQEVIKTTKITKILSAFAKYSTFNSELFYSTDLNRRVELGEAIDNYGFSLKESLLISAAPVRENYEGGIDMFEYYIKTLSEFLYMDNLKMVSAPKVDKFEHKEYAKDKETLKEAEETLHDIELYNWFSNKFPEVFFDKEGVLKGRELLNNFIINTFKTNKY